MLADPPRAVKATRLNAPGSRLGTGQGAPGSYADRDDASLRAVPQTNNERPYPHFRFER